MDLLYIWYGNTYWSKILFSTIPTPANDLKSRLQTEIYVKVLRLGF